MTLLALCVVNGTMTVPCVAQPETPTDRYRSIRVIVSTDRQRYSRRDGLKVSVALHNEGNDPMYIDRRMLWTGFGGGLALEVRDDHGNHLAVRPLSDVLLLPPTETDAQILIRLEGGFFYGTSLGLVVKDFFPKPGRYSIRVTYKSWLRKEYVAPKLRDLPALWEDTPALTSRPIWVVVTR